MSVPDGWPVRVRVFALTLTSPSASDERSESSRTGPTIGYMPALDGLRALAVVAVVLYHGEIGGLPGGFLGVEVFFVISGYLITSLLIAERQRTGATAYLAFWARRARRLLPALFALVGVVAVVWSLLHHDELARVRGDMVGALTYVTNWYQIIVQQSYFEAIGRPSPLRHLWSLAVEEQFYIVWPVALAVIHRVTRGRRQQMLLITGALALVSAVYAVVLFQPGVDPSRVYYGTDTRAAGVLLGAALAIAVPPWLMRARIHRNAMRTITIIGAVGLAGTVMMFMWVNEFDSFIYQGGFILLDLLTLAVIVSLVHPCRTIWSRFFALGPLLWIGRRSYGIYLWHWPIFVLTRPHLDIPMSGWSLLGLRLALTMAVAEVSYRFVEMPVRDGALGRWWAKRSQPGGLVAPRARRPAMVAGVLAMGILALVLMARPPHESLAGVDLTGAVTDSLGNVVDETTSVPNSAAPTTTVATVVVPVTPSAPTTTAAPAPIAPSGAGGSVTAIGDSVLLGARTAVRTALPGVTVNAEVGRQFNVLPGVIRSLAGAGSLRSSVVVHLGTNGPPTEADLKKSLDALSGQRRVVLVTTSEPRSWQDLTNQRIRAAAAGRPNVVVADWNAAASGHPDYFVADGVHLSVAGAAAYANTISAALR